jgi:hypothetical protein
MYDNASFSIDSVRSPVTKVRPKGIGCLFDTRLKEIVARELWVFRGRQLGRHLTVCLIENAAQGSIAEWLQHLTGGQNMLARNKAPRTKEPFSVFLPYCPQFQVRISSHHATDHIRRPGPSPEMR